jgi:hypothetical protein
MRGKLLPAASRPRLKAATTKKKFRKSRKVFVSNLPRTFAIVRLFPIFFLDSTRKRVTRALTNSSGSLFVRVVSSPHFETTLFEYGLQCVSVRLVRRGSKPPRHCAERIAVLMGTATTDSVRKCSAVSALGQKQTFSEACGMSALPPKADVGTQSRNVRFVPIADSCTAAIIGRLRTDTERRLCRTSEASCFPANGTT